MRDLYLYLARNGRTKTKSDISHHHLPTLYRFEKNDAFSLLYISNVGFQIEISKELYCKKGCSIVHA